MNTLFDSLFTLGFDDHYTAARSHNRPAVNIHETNDAFVIEVAAPGMEKSDFELNVENETLTLLTKRTTEEASETRKFKRREFSIGNFKRSFVLPDSVDAEAINATYTNGILALELPKKPEAKPIVKSIEIA